MGTSGFALGGAPERLLGGGLLEEAPGRSDAIEHCVPQNGARVLIFAAGLQQCLSLMKDSPANAA